MTVSFWPIKHNITSFAGEAGLAVFFEKKVVN